MMPLKIIVGLARRSKDGQVELINSLEAAVDITQNDLQWSSFLKEDEGCGRIERAKLLQLRIEVRLGQANS